MLIHDLNPCSDLHAGKGYPIGVSLVSTDTVYPHLIGNDIGCGMSLVQTPISRDAATMKQLTKWVHDIYLDDSWANQVADGNTVQKEKFMEKVLGNELMDWPMNQKQNGMDVDQVIEHGIDVHAFDDSLGTIGGGNHFAELQCIESIEDEIAFTELGLNEDRLYLMIHSGSRGLGNAILDDYLSSHKAKRGLDVESDDFKRYMELHDNALRWARKNRMIIAQRFLECLGTGNAYDFDQCTCHIDIYHNYLALKDGRKFEETQKEIARRENRDESEPEINGDSNGKLSVITNGVHDKESKEDPDAVSNGDVNQNDDSANDQIFTLTPEPEPEPETEQKENELENVQSKDSWYIHRKGAAPSDCGAVVIPGSRGSHSYIVKPIGEGSCYSGYSLAHGAGRKMMRSKALAKMSKWYPNVNVLSRTEKFGSYVICEDKELMYEEAPAAYKDISQVIQDMVDFNLITVIAILKPLITYKTKGGAQRESKKAISKKRHHGSKSHAKNSHHLGRND